MYIYNIDLIVPKMRALDACPKGDILMILLQMMQKLSMGVTTFLSGIYLSIYNIYLSIYIYR